MLTATVNLELAIDGASQTIVRDHSAHGTLDQQFRTTLAAIAEGLGFVTTDISGEAHVALLDVFLAADLHFPGVDHDYEITRINVRGENSFSFAAKEVCGFHGNMPEMLPGGVYDPPVSLDFGGFGGVGLHSKLT